MKSFVLEFFIAARFANLAVSLPQYQFASHWHVRRQLDPRKQSSMKVIAWKQNLTSSPTAGGLVSFPKETNASIGR